MMNLCSGSISISISARRLACRWMVNQYQPCIAIGSFADAQNNIEAFASSFAGSGQLEPTHVASQRRFISVTRACPKELPYHLVVGLPALSPTMMAGTLAEWYLQEGDSFAAGDGIAKIETDKAAMDFEAQDDGFVAKILMPASGDDIAVGTPILITVETAEDVAAFQDYVVPATAPPVDVKPAVVAAPVVQAVTPPPSPPLVAAPIAASVPPVAPAAVTPPPPVAQPVSLAVFSTAWGGNVVATSPLAKSLAEAQNNYIGLYGTTGQLPIIDL